MGCAKPGLAEIKSCPFMDAMATRKIHETFPYLLDLVAKDQNPSLQVGLEPMWATCSMPEVWECLVDLSGRHRVHKGARLYLCQSRLCTQGKFVFAVEFLTIDEGKANR